MLFETLGSYRMPLETLDESPKFYVTLEVSTNFKDAPGISNILPISPGG
jgi:hypothetical protein